MIGHMCAQIHLPHK